MANEPEGRWWRRFERGAGIRRSQVRELLVLGAGRLTDDEAGGATKLNKVLYVADFAHVRRTGRSITGATHQKLANGPAPRRLLPVRKQLMTCGDAELVERDFLGYKQNRLIPKQSTDESVFDAESCAPSTAFSPTSTA